MLFKRFTTANKILCFLRMSTNDWGSFYAMNLTLERNEFLITTPGEYLFYFEIVNDITLRDFTFSNLTLYAKQYDI